MATKQVNIDIIAKDKTRQAMRSATLGVNKLKDSVFNLRNALVGLGAGLVAKSFIDTGREVERLRVRFKFLFDEASEGEKAFKGLIKFASQVPFSLEEIQRGSANLAVVSKDADELNRLLRITGDVASASGLDFQTTAEQIQRTFSGGINSADLFRERGVKALLGFQAGVQISAEESRNHILKAFDEGTLSVVGASATMAKTFDGTLSMIGDKFNLFKMAVMDSAPFDFLKSGAILIEEELSKNFGSIEKAGEKLGVAIVDAMKSALRFGARALDFFDPFFRFIKKSVGNLIEFAQGIPAPFDTIGVLGFLLLGAKGKGLILILGGFIDTIRHGIAEIMNGIVKLQEFTNKFKITSFLQSEEDIKKEKQAIEDMKLTIEKLRTPISEVDEKFGDIIDKKPFKQLNEGSSIFFEKTTKNRDALEEVLQKMEKKIELLKKEKEIIQPNALSGLTGSEMDIKGQDILQEGMSGSELLGESSPKIVALQQMADLEVEIAKATAEKTLAISKETADKEMEIRKKVFNDNFELIKSGKASEIDLEKMSGKDKVDLAKKVGREGLDQLAQSNRKAFQLNKAFRMAEAIMDTAGAVAKVLPNIPLAIAIGAFGAIQIASIASTKFQGRRLGGRMNQGEPYMVGEAGAELVVPDRPSNVVPNSKLGSSQPVTVNFNINTVDARGFNELLVNSRGVIVNIINSAMNEKGKMAIV